MDFFGGHDTPRVGRIGADARGVTTVELGVVLGIVLLLAIVVLTSVGGIRGRQKTSACKAELRKMQTAVEAYRALPGIRNPKAEPPPDLAALRATGLVSGRVGKYVTYTRVRSRGRLVARYTNSPQGNCVPS